jgi:hypothetical protein
LSASVLAIVIAVGEASNPATASLRASAQESLGPGTSILLVESVRPTDAEALRIEGQLAAGAVVLLVWKEAAHLHAILRLHVANGTRWITREIGFSPQDTLEERGRTLGFTVGSIWPDAGPGRRSPPEARPPPDERSSPETRSPSEERAPSAATAPPEERSPPAPVPPADGVGAAPPRRSQVESRPRRLRPEAAPVPEPSTSISTPAETTRYRPVRVGISAVGAMGIGGPAYGLGAGADGEIFVRRALGFRLGASVRTGSISELPGRDLVTALAGGLAWWPAPTSSVHPVGFGLRADVLALHHQVTTTISGQQESAGRFVPGADLLLSAALRLTSRVEVVASLGAEMAFGTTEIRTGSPPQTVATIPSLREVAEAGFRLGF